jgi:hypothetical protein
MNRLTPAEEQVMLKVWKLEKMTVKDIGVTLLFLAILFSSMAMLVLYLIGV